MTIKNMDHIYTVYEEGSFSRAASRLYISQPALSNAVKKVEKELGVELFDRSSAPIRPTPAGEYYLECIRRVKEVENDLDRYLEQLRHSKKKQLNVGGSTFFCSYLLPALARYFEGEFPGCSLQLTEGGAAELRAGLLSGKLDATIDAEMYTDDVVAAEFLCREHILLCVPSSYKVNEKLKEYRLTFEQVRSGLYLEPDVPAVDLWHFKKEPFLLLKEGNDSLPRAQKMCRSAGFTPKVAMHLDQMYTSYCVACEGRGIAFMRAAITHAAQPSDKVFFYRINNNAARRDLYLHYRRSSLSGQTMPQFLEFMKKNAPGPLR